jgi:V/A-type H+-transporting ATPase subunit D
MTVLNFTPTRSNLIFLKNRLAFAKEGFSILDKKREVLTAELLSRVEEAKNMQLNLLKRSQAAYHSLEHARLTMGQERIQWAALAVNKSIQVDIRNLGMMGVPLANITAYGNPPDISYSLEDTSVALDEAMDNFRKFLEEIPNYAALVSSVWRIAKELEKTQRRVHALERIFIPDYTETIRFIENSLEEHEREETFRLKWLKKKQTEQ